MVTKIKPVPRAKPGAFVQFTLLGGNVQKIRPELIGGITIGPDKAEIICTNFRSAYHVSPEEGHRIAALLDPNPV